MPSRWEAFEGEARAPTGIHGREPQFIPEFALSCGTVVAAQWTSPGNDLVNGLEAIWLEHVTQNAPVRRFPPMNQKLQRGASRFLRGAARRGVAATPRRSRDVGSRRRLPERRVAATPPET